ncbi:hypothetical protein LTR78_004806 [Recurvomyces mirabilis]|uniref:Uncharacterized protein n=2 Tax=Recurvomyces mirabilis TaxID=574656 RepID=A0AAE0WNY8_9PEZI|nr:hypothetical protein LTR78_004806 [Recurvomyces mirabilis]
MLKLCDLDNSQLESKDRTPWLIVKDPFDYGYEPGNEIGALQPLKSEHIDIDRPQDWVPLNWMHEKQTQPLENGPVYPPTGAQFRVLINQAASVLVATISTTPDNLKHPLPIEQRVPLKRWSDMAYLSWEILMYQTDARTKLAPPERIIRLNIYTTKTRQAIAHVLGGQMKEYPGQVFDARSEEGMMLMGTPHGKGVAYFLFQHKHFMGVWTIDQIQVWDSVGHVPGSDGVGRWPSMAFYFKPVVSDFRSIDGKMLKSTGPKGEGDVGEESGGQGREQESSREQQGMDDVRPGTEELQRVSSSIGAEQVGGSAYQAGQESSTPEPEQRKGDGSRWQKLKSTFSKKKDGSGIS